MGEHELLNNRNLKAVELLTWLLEKGEVQHMAYRG